MRRPHLQGMSIRTRAQPHQLIHVHAAHVHSCWQLLLLLVAVTRGPLQAQHSRTGQTAQALNSQPCPAN